MHHLVLDTHQTHVNLVLKDSSQDHQTVKQHGTQLTQQVPNGRTQSSVLMILHSVGAASDSAKNMMLHQMDSNGRDLLKWDKV